MKEDERTGAEGVGGRGQKAKEDEIRWVLEDLCQLLEDEKRWLMEDVARRPPSYYGLFYKYINIQRHTVIV